MNNKTYKNIIIILILILSFTIAYYLIKKYTEKEYEEPKSYLKNYEVNEYIPVYISDEHMARIYLNDYIDKMLYNTEEAYLLLNEEYRNKKFGSYENYLNYVKGLNNYEIYLNKFYKKSFNGFLYFGVYDSNNNLYLFETNGVMQYSVYLDENTVEIW